MSFHRALILVAAFLAAVFEAPLQAQQPSSQPTCPLPQVTLQEKQELSAPAGFDQLAFFDTKDQKVAAAIGEGHGAPGAQTVTIGPVAIGQARDLKKKASAADQIQLRWGKKSEAGAECLQPFDVAAAPAAHEVSAGDVADLRVTKLVMPPAKAETPAERKQEAARQSARTASLGDTIELQTSPDLGKYLDDAAKQNKAITLFLDGNDTGIAPEALDREAGTLRFHLERNGDNKNVWSALLRDPFHHQTRKVKASVGLAGGAAVPAENSTFTLWVVNWAGSAFFWLFLLVVLLVVFAWLAAKRDLLRDGPRPCPYSLGRCQMAWWFFLIIVGYVMIWLISGDQDTITPSIVALMGISAGTALGSVLIESTSGSTGLSQAATDRLALQAAQQNAQQSVTAAQNAVNAAPADPVAQKQLGDAQAGLAVASAKLLAVNNQINGIAAAPQTRGFLRDILSDSNGTMGLHRFQIVVWTIVLGIIFLVSVVMQLSMPVFSATLLATMGISSGTYLGFKFPEK